MIQQLTVEGDIWEVWRLELNCLGFLDCGGNLLMLLQPSHMSDSLTAWGLRV